MRPPELQEWALGQRGRELVIVLVSFCLQGRGSGQAERPFVDQFGFDVVTCCGYLPQVSVHLHFPAWLLRHSRGHTLSLSCEV